MNIAKNAWHPTSQVSRQREETINEPESDELDSQLFGPSDDRYEVVDVVVREMQ